MEEELINEENDLKYFKRLVIQNMLLIFAIVIIVIFGVSFLVYIFYIEEHQFDNFICDISEMNPREIESFNSKFTTYDGKQTGAKLKSLIGTLIANANTYEDDSEKCPTVAVMNDNNEIAYLAHYASINNSNITYEGIQKIYIDNLAIIRNSLQNKNYYSVEFEYTEKGLVNTIIITGEIKGLNERK